MSSHHLRTGDQQTLRWSLGRDLTEASQIFVVVSRFGEEPLFVRPGIFDPDDPQSVSLLLSSEDTAVPGRWETQVRVHWPDGSVITHPGPEQRASHIVIADDLDPGWPPL